MNPDTTNPRLVARPEPVPGGGEGDHADWVSAVNAVYPADFPQNNNETKTNKNKNRKDQSST